MDERYDEKNQGTWTNNGQMPDILKDGNILAKESEKKERKFWGNGCGFCSGSSFPVPSQVFWVMKISLARSQVFIFLEPSCPWL